MFTLGVSLLFNWFCVNICNDLALGCEWGFEIRCFVLQGLVLGVTELGLKRYDDEWTKDHRLRPRMGVYAEGDHKAEEHSRRVAWAAVQFRGLHDALHVLISMPFRFSLFCLLLWLYVFSKFEFNGDDCDIVCFAWIFMCRTIYNMCTQKPPHDYSQQLYDKYRESFEEYITSTVRNILCVCVWLHVFLPTLFEVAWIGWPSMTYDMCVIKLLAVEYHAGRYIKKCGVIV